VSIDSQGDRILKLLESRQGWVPAPELAQISLQYCARLHSLRRQGIDIENKVEIRNGVRHGFYRLRRPAPITVQPRAQASVLQAESGSLFGSLAPERYPD
jgi:hypothetical protein